MQAKACHSTGSCDPSFVKSCLHARTPMHYANHFFTPKYTGEHCDHYLREVTVDEAIEEKLARLMGAHE